MKKTISINISGVVFNIEEDAYEVLKRYLDTIAGYFESTEGRDEIMGDIENRIAELFQARLSESKNVISSQDVDEVTSVMGRPEDYLTEEEAATDKGRGHKSTGRKSQGRRLYRDKDKNVLGGVCAGMAHYFGWDPVWIRISWAVSIFVFGVGILPYIILWFVIPGAESTAEKLEMMGEPVTVDSIKRKVNETIDDVKAKTGGQVDTDFHYSYAKNQVGRGGDFIIDLVKKVFGLVGKLIGGILLFGGIAFITAFVYYLLEGTLFGGMDALGIDFGDLKAGIFTSDLNAYTLFFGGLFLVLTPIIGCLFLGSKLLFSIKSSAGQWIAILFGVWLIGLIMVGVSSARLGIDFSNDYTRTEESFQSGTEAILVLESSEMEYGDRQLAIIDDGHLIKFGDNIHCAYPDLSITRNIGSDKVELKTRYIGRGATVDAAVHRADNISYELSHQSDTIYMPPSFSYPLSDKMRGQELELELRIPLGQRIYIAHSLEEMLDEAPTRGTFDLEDLLGREWVMTEDGLSLTLDEEAEPVELDADEEGL